ncbi:DNA-3-methyladenine glycosylase [Staphylococcus americanisciuri]|uniref:Putative 3-methyladenine DNA glycosylase n=1 Tax=Staphylococcus americanisciuri TaxID=2973940 RepID=A0ABT2F0V2_9STAP|nr:DNA-3-methyladenine glycosylase [Staphylococcus americanisciuri]MCS4486079.1 DNA-3-methyladenine glycosylase [Staphylococcus americanisciuri]
MDFITWKTTDIAKSLLGAKLIYEAPEHTYSGYIVETEAYLGTMDQAAHSYRGKHTPRVNSLYCEGGTIYAHMMHRYLLINVVTQPEGIPEGVLIRAIEPNEGLDAMVRNRGKAGYDVTNGPGKLTIAMDIPRTIDGTRLNEGRLKIDTLHRKYPRAIVSSPRIGIPNKGKWTEAPLRFTVKGNPFVSHMRVRDCQHPDETWC